MLCMAGVVFPGLNINYDGCQVRDKFSLWVCRQPTPECGQSEGRVSELGVVVTFNIFTRR